MKLKKAGKNISKVEILNVSKNGIWILALETEYFLNSKDFPWFLNATIDQICNVKLLHKRHLYWPDLDVDLEIGSLKNIESYPLIAI